ncbi:MAG TPA: FGGY family carbohydrate kinase [Acidimicrobiales bacterium]|nr:FGGY family carbohydrate kinase [Acidimicrobiales bacterium]
MAPVLLGIDLGTTRTKALLADAAGETVAIASVPTPFPDGGAAPAEMGVDQLLAAVGEALAGLGAGLGEVRGVGIAGMAESGAPVDAAGRAVGPVVGWHDPRGRETVDLLLDRFPELDGWIGQRLRTVSTVAKLGWLAAERGTGAVPRWLGVPELCLHGLTGAMATEFSLAARTGAYDVGRRCYRPEVLAALGLDVAVLPEVRPAGVAMGVVSGSGAAWSGLPAGIPVTIAGHDHLVGVVGAGTGPGDLVNSVGTAETLVARCPVPPDTRAAVARRAAVTVAPGGGEWAVLASAGRAGHVLAPVSRQLGRSPAELDRLASAAAPAGAGRVDAAGLVERILAGECWSLPDAEPGRVWSGVLWAMAARTWEAVGRLEGLLGPARRLVVFGGGSASRPWMEAKAALASLPVWRSRATEAVARGAALFGGVAAGWWPAAEEAPMPGLVRVSPGSAPGPPGPPGPPG